jgi:hypothetical protein
VSWFEKFYPNWFGQCQSKCRKSPPFFVQTITILVMKKILAFGSVLLFATACNSTPTISNPEVEASIPSELNLSDPVAVQKAALKLWRKPIAKGSCSGCHGPDFFDLARIGSSDATITRRALADTATRSEAKALVQVVKNLRQKHKLPTENPLEFRPFQPGGAILPGATPVERDIAMGRQLERLEPTLMGARIDSLEAAKRAKDEMLKLDLRSIQIGIAYPRWSADLFHGADHGTMNDWISDVARVARPDTMSAWRALEDEYLSDPSNENFWRMYAAVDTLTAMKDITQDEAVQFSANKFKATLIGQHLLRTQALGRKDATQGALAFSYLQNSDYANVLKTAEFLPGKEIWGVGDATRALLGGAGLEKNPSRTDVISKGFPNFVADSIDPNMTVQNNEQAMRVSWFWLGFTVDPSLNRVSGSNSTKSAEYLVASLIQERMFLHNSFMTHQRMLHQGFTPEGTYKGKPKFTVNYGYFIGYNRQHLNWNEAKFGNVDPALKSVQQNLWTRFTLNGFRMSLYLYLDTLNAMTPTELVKEKLLETQKGTNIISSTYAVLTDGLNFYQPEHKAADNALIQQVISKLGF